MALEELCRTYWYPLYAYVRRRGHSREDAEDLTQGFFAQILRKDFFAGLSSDKGRFRAFLLAALKHFMANEWDKSKRQKRGGGAAVLSLDWERADSRYQVDPPDLLSPDKLYDRAWAMTLLERVIEKLRCEYEAAGRAQQFAVLKIFLTAGKGAQSHAQAAQSLGLEEATVRVMVHRLRRRYRELLREEIAQTLDDPAQVAEEMAALFSAFTV